MHLTTFYVELNRRDETIAGTLGDVDWIDNTSCYITTDDWSALQERLEDDDNVLFFQEVDEDGNHETSTTIDADDAWTASLEGPIRI